MTKLVHSIAPQPQWVYRVPEAAMAKYQRTCQNKGCTRHFLVDDYFSKKWYCCEDCEKGVKPTDPIYRKKNSKRVDF